MLRQIFLGALFSVAISTLILVLMGLAFVEALRCGVLGIVCAIGGIWVLGVFARTPEDKKRQKKPSDEA